MFFYSTSSLFILFIALSDRNQDDRARRFLVSGRVNESARLSPITPRSPSLSPWAEACFAYQILIKSGAEAVDQLSLH